MDARDAGVLEQQQAAGTAYEKKKDVGTKWHLTLFN
jgi:hypothetical protein